MKLKTDKKIGKIVTQKNYAQILETTYDELIVEEAC